MYECVMIGVTALLGATCSLGLLYVGIDTAWHMRNARRIARDFPVARVRRSRCG